MISKEEARAIAGSGSIHSENLMKFHNTGEISSFREILTETYKAQEFFQKRAKELPHPQGRKDAHNKLYNWNQLNAYLEFNYIFS